MMTPDCWIYDSEVLFQAHSAAPRILLVVVQSIIQADCMHAWLPHGDISISHILTAVAASAADDKRPVNTQ